MKKKLFLLLIASFSYLFISAQIKNEVTKLYLLPFHLNETDIPYSVLKSCEEIHQVKQFEMMGFWLGTKMALHEYDYSNKFINVIVRDAVTDALLLNKILEDTALMMPVNIIIGPFYGSLFPVAAEYAKEHQITIVNPFSTRFDFVQENPNVYKLVPPFLSRPETIAEHFLSLQNEYTITLWGDSVTSPELLAYRYYFNEQNIYFKETNSLTLRLDSKKKNLIIALFDSPERVINSVHSITNLENKADIVVVVPEKWISISELTDDFFKLPHLYYFTNFFVDNNCEKVKRFQSDYLYNYEVQAELISFSYQGYDITRYFIDLFFAEYNIHELHFQPLSYQFQWNQIMNGGFENSKVRLIRVKDLGLEEVR
jgi:hypothetical protein